jgi:hypothetical protein
LCQDLSLQNVPNIQPDSSDTLDIENFRDEEPRDSSLRSE